MLGRLGNGENSHILSDNQKSHMITITMLGEPGTGKTSLRNHLFGEKFNDKLQMTIGASYQFTQFEMDQNLVKLRICDIAGQSSYEMLRKNYMNLSDGAILVFDLTKIDTLKKLSEWVTDYLTVHSSKNIPLLLVGNKSDLTDHRQVRLKDVELFLQVIEKNPVLEKNIIGYIETSAKTGENVNIGFSKMASAINKLTNAS